MRPGGVLLPAKRSTRRAVPRPARGEPVQPRLSSLPAVNAAIPRTAEPERPSERQRRRTEAQAAVGEGWAPPTDLEPRPAADPVDLEDPGR
ncbi:hypothetical protein [Pseudonocardia xishanensis]|uniref:Uncharacterized protein n=1 Tax=Pseudonocardia xishanensis TaxID=630995 RepID=A0ABP8S0S8_9PSEU